MSAPVRRVLPMPLTVAIDQVLRSRCEPTLETPRLLRSRHPRAPAAVPADGIISRYRGELGGMAAAPGGIAAVPGIGAGIMGAGSVSDSAPTGESRPRSGCVVLVRRRGSAP